MAKNQAESAKQPGVPAKVTFLEGRGELPMIEITTPWSTAEIYLQGAHVTHFKKQHEPPLLFLSQCSRFEEGYPIRGGVPIIFPWFGPREGMGAHGFARAKTWELKEFVPEADGSVSVRLRLPEYPEAATYPPFELEYVVKVSQELSLELVVTNKSAEDRLEIEGCLHPYFTVDDISAVSVIGLEGYTYLDRVADFARKVETERAIRISSEVDRTYLNATGNVEIHDARFGRLIRMEKKNSASTVLWNPWIAKAQQLPDFGNEEYRNMICVEPGNVASNNIALQPGESSSLQVKLSTAPLA